MSPIKNVSHASNHSLTFLMPALKFAHCGWYPRGYQMIFLWSHGSAPDWVSLMLGLLLNNELGTAGVSTCNAFDKAACKVWDHRVLKNCSTCWGTNPPSTDWRATTLRDVLLWFARDALRFRDIQPILSCEGCLCNFDNIKTIIMFVLVSLLSSMCWEVKPGTVEGIS